MNDRQLLEAAAKAAGPEFVNLLSHGKWDPIADDASALRLAVKLNIWPVRRCFSSAPTIIAVQPGEAYWESLADEPVGPDPYAATRRAIVRAAAAMAGEKE